jgi:hypothetical protein
MEYLVTRVFRYVFLQLLYLVFNSFFLARITIGAILYVLVFIPIYASKEESGGRRRPSAGTAINPQHRGPPAEGCRAGAGLGRLQKEVRTCEYDDVHVTWEMLSNPRTGRKLAVVIAAAWSRLAFYCCGLCCQSLYIQAEAAAALAGGCSCC